MKARGADFAPVVMAYLICITAVAAVLAGVGAAQPWDAFFADAAATLVVFAFSRRYRNSSFYDPYWSVIPPLLVYREHMRRVSALVPLPPRKA